MKQFDFYATTPLKFRTWPGVFLSLITVLAVAYFAYLQVMTFFPRISEAPHPQFRIQWQDSTGKAVAVDTTYGKWYATELSWQNLNPAGYVVESNTELESCGTNQFCYNGKPTLTGNPTAREGQNLWIRFLPCYIETPGPDCKTGGPLFGFLGTLTLNRTTYGESYVTDNMTQVPTTTLMTYSKQVVTTTVTQNNVVANNPYTGMLEYSYMQTFGSFSSSTSMSPNNIKDDAIAVRFTASTGNDPYTIVRPHHSTLTVLSSIGGFAVGLFCVLKVLMFVYISIAWSCMENGIFSQRPKGFREMRTQRRRLNRELSVKKFLKQ